MSDPFARKPQKKVVSTAHQIKKDATRENVKKTLINALEPKKDDNCKYTSEKIALEIEEEIYKQNNNSSQSKSYREKIRKIELRIKGSRNLFIRKILKNGLIEIKTFCELDEKTLNDDNYFKKLSDDINDNETLSTVNKGNSFINKPGKIPIKSTRPPIVKMNIFQKRPIENNNNIVGDEIKEKKNDNFDGNNGNEIKEIIQDKNIQLNKDNIKSEKESNNIIVEKETESPKKEEKKEEEKKEEEIKKEEKKEE